MKRREFITQLGGDTATWFNAAHNAPLPPSEAGVTMGHWHLNSGDVDANRKIFLALGGTAFKLGTFEIVKFPGVYVYLNMPQGAPPSAGGNDGAVVNQVG